MIISRAACITLMVLISLNALYCTISMFWFAPPMLFHSPDKPKDWDKKPFDNRTIPMIRRAYGIEFWISVGLVLFLAYICPQA